MNNWWIAALEHAGVWTRDQAEHVANEVKNTVHREKYSEAFDELATIVGKGEFNNLPLLSKLEADVENVMIELGKLKDLPKDIYAALEEMQKTIEAQKPKAVPKPVAVK